MRRLICVSEAKIPASRFLKLYKLKKFVGSNNFSAQLIKINSHYKNIDYNINVSIYCNRLLTWWSTQSQLATLISSLIARRWVGL